MNDAPIGILDSGVGGLSLLSEMKKILPLESFIYVADSKNVPYSGKSDGEVYELAKKMLEFLLEKKAKLIVIACNTITVSCLDKLREEFKQIPIVGTVPVVRKAAHLTKTGKIGIFSTTKTAASQYQENLIQKFAGNLEVLNIGSDIIASHIEHGEIGDEFEKILERELEPFKNSDIDVLALGCTHYPLVKDKIQTILGPKIAVIDSGAAIARQVKRILEQNNALSNSERPTCGFYTSGRKEIFEKWIKKFDLKGEINSYGI